MPQPTSVERADRVATFAFDFDALVDGEADACIVQSPRIGDDDITGDASRPATVRVLRQLLAPDEAGACRLDELLPGRRAKLVLAPEYALGSPDWATVDEAVRTCPRNLVLIVGFGATSGAWLAAWLREQGQTGRSGTWEPGPGSLGPGHVYGGGWVWIHGPGTGTHCVCFLKTFLQQRDEAAIPNMGRGDFILRVKLNDLDLFPLICAELLQEPGEGVVTALRRVRRALDSEGATARPALVTACVLQEPPSNVNWRRAIAAAVSSSDVRPVRLLIANQACGRPCVEEDHDRWRSLSGAFVGYGSSPKGYRAFPGGRPVSLDGIFQGMVIRDSGPCLAAGPLVFRPRTVVTSLDLWRVQTTAPLGADGLLPPRGYDGTICGHELHRLTLRCPGRDEWGAVLRNGLERVRGHLCAAGHPDAASVLASLLGGTSRSPVDADAFHGVMDRLSDAMHALATLAALDGLRWHGREGYDGQLSFEEAEAHVLVWNDPQRTGREMIRMLEAWALETGPLRRLVVFGAGCLLPLDEGPVQGDRRTELTAPPPGGDEDWEPLAEEGGPDISVPRIRRAVACIGLHEVAAVYVDGERPAEEALALLADILRRGREWLAA
ncbi:ABC-three component system protein [Methylobacterium sp. JK268]